MMMQVFDSLLLYTHVRSLIKSTWLKKGAQSVNPRWATLLAAGK